MDDDVLMDGNGPLDEQRSRTSDRLRAIEDISLDDAPSSQDQLQAQPQQESYDDLAPAQRARYVRQRAPRRTQEAIDDLAEDDSPVSYAHESNVAVGGLVSDRSYRRARSDISRVRKSPYGQYLEVPKGRRSIFAKQERSRRRRSALAAILVVAILAAAAYFVWQIMSNISFG